MAEIDIIAVHDTYAKEDAATTNYGSDTTMWIRAYAVKDCYDFFKWDLSAYAGKNINSATLYVRCTSTGSPALPNCYTKLVDADWAESTLIWNNKPSETGAAIFDNFDFLSAGWYNDGGAITDTVQNWLDGSNNYGIILRGVEGGNGLSYIGTSENSGNEPYLKIDFKVAAGGFSGTHTANWLFLKDMWEKHKKIWIPKKRILKPKICIV